MSTSRSTTRRLGDLTPRSTNRPARRYARRAVFEEERTEADSPPVAPDEPPPAAIGRYEVRGVLGRGGMATVYRAFDPVRGEEVALKVLRGGRDSRRVERLRREAELALRMRHPSFVPALDLGERDGRTYLAMELIEGPTLAQTLEREGRLAPARAAALVARIARAVDALHAEGVVHRDLKPHNVILHATRGPLVLDLGLAKDLRSRRPLTARHEIVGTLSYMAPEQVQGSVDVRADVWGLGAVLYALLTGVPPFAGGKSTVVRRLLHGAPLAPRHLVLGLPPALDALVMAALSRDPLARPPSAGALAAALEALGSRDAG